MRPVLHVLELDVRISVNEVDADQLLAALTLEARQTLTDCSAHFLFAGGAVLTLSQLAERLERKGRLTKLATKESKNEMRKSCTRVPQQF